MHEKNSEPKHWKFTDVVHWLSINPPVQCTDRYKSLEGSGQSLERAQWFVVSKTSAECSGKSTCIDWAVFCHFVLFINVWRLVGMSLWVSFQPFRPWRDGCRYKQGPGRLYVSHLGIHPPGLFWARICLIDVGILSATSIIHILQLHPGQKVAPTKVFINTRTYITKIANLLLTLQQLPAWLAYLLDEFID